MVKYGDPQNHYSYFSRWNMYQLDIITTCRRLGIPLEKVKQILSFRDNDKVVAFLMEADLQQQSVSFLKEAMSNEANRNG